MERRIHTSPNHMSTITEKRITKIELVNGTIYKGMTMRGPGFIMDVTLHLEDGTLQRSHVDAQRKKDVLPKLERDRRNAENGSMKASFLGSDFFGTVTHSRMDGSGLQPVES